MSNAVRQLQNCVTERSALECVELFVNEHKRAAAGGMCRNASKVHDAELAYQRKAESLHEENAKNEENIFKVYIVSAKS